MNEARIGRRVDGVPKFEAGSRRNRHGEIISELLTYPLLNSRWIRFYLPGCESKPVRFFAFSVEGARLLCLGRSRNSPAWLQQRLVRSRHWPAFSPPQGANQNLSAFLRFPLRFAAPVFEATDVRPRMVAAASRPEPPLACLFRRPGCEPKPVRFLRFPASPTRAGGFQNHLVRRCRLETVPGVPTFGPAGRRRGSALGARPLHDQGKSAPRREADASQAPRGSSLYRDFRRLLYRTG
jgi:hypothetical protein